jgi:cyclic lactone autoinducer peptide
MKGGIEMKFNKNVLLTVVSVIATFFATVVATSACWWVIYQPEEPKCLQDM